MTPKYRRRTLSSERVWSLRCGRGLSLIDLFCSCFKTERIVLDDTFDAVHGGQQLSLFNAHRLSLQPIHIFEAATGKLCPQI